MKERILPELISLLSTTYSIKSMGWKKDEYRIEAEMQIAPGTYITVSYYPMLAGRDE